MPSLKESGLNPELPPVRSTQRFCGHESSLSKTTITLSDSPKAADGSITL